MAFIYHGRKNTATPLRGHPVTRNISSIKKKKNTYKQQQQYFHTGQQFSTLTHQLINFKMTYVNNIKKVLHEINGELTLHGNKMLKNSRL